MPKLKVIEAHERFFADVRFEVSEGFKRAGPELSKTRGNLAHGNQLSNSRAGVVFAQIIDRHASEFVEKMRSRYELARKGRGADTEILHTIWVQGLDSLMTMAREIARVGDEALRGGADRERVLDETLEVFKAQQVERINHAIRGIEAQPQRPWHERHPLWLALGSAAVGAAASEAVQSLLGLI